MKCIGCNLQKQGVTALLSLVLMNTSCDEHIDPAKLSPSDEGKMVEVSFNIGFANEVDGATLSTSPATKSNQTNGRQAAFDMQLLPAAQTKAATNHPDKLYNLEIYQYTTNGAFLASITDIGSIDPGTAITKTLNNNNGNECQLVIIARGETGAVSTFGNKTLSAVNAITADTTQMKSINASTGENINNMPYLLYLPKVKIVNGKLTSPEGTDVRLLLKRLAVGLTIDWTFSQDMVQKGYTLSEVRLMQVPKDYRILPETEEIAPYNGKMYPIGVSEFVDGFRLKGDKLASAGGDKGTQTLWMPANARGIRNDVTYPNYRNKNYAHPAATYMEFVVDGNNQRLLYRAYLGANNTNDFNLLENTNYNWTIRINNANYTNDPRIQPLDLTPVISTNLQTTANCFMMKPGTNICFNPYQHEAGTNGWNTELTTGGTAIQVNKNITKVEVLWQTKDTGTSGDLVMGYVVDNTNHKNLVNLTNGSDINKARIHVKVPVTNGGNAVIAAYNNKTIVWSWHLWISDYVPQGITSSITYEEAQRLTKGGSVHQYTAASVFKNGGIYQNKVMMDRNLCATAGGFPGKDASLLEFAKRIGYLYYWGRKDPFFGSVDGTANEINVIYDGDGIATNLKFINYLDVPLTNGNTMLWTIQNPTSIILNNYSWYNGREQSDLLQLYDNNGVKTLYDPCPEGWTIPYKTALDNCNINTAQWFNNNGLFVSSGTQHPKAGRLYNVSGQTSVATPMTIHNSSWYPTTAFRSKADGLLRSSTNGYLGTRTMTLTSGNYRIYYVGFTNSSWRLENTIGYIGEPYPFRCIQK